MAKNKYMRMLITLPDSTYQEFKKTVPKGTRSQTISILIRQYLGEDTKKNNITNWEEFKKYRKGDYSHEDPVKLSKDVWKYID